MVRAAAEEQHNAEDDEPDDCQYFNQGEPAGESAAWRTWRRAQFGLAVVLDAATAVSGARHANETRKKLNEQIVTA